MGFIPCGIGGGFNRSIHLVSPIPLLKRWIFFASLSLKSEQLPIVIVNPVCDEVERIALCALDQPTLIVEFKCGLIPVLWSQRICTRISNAAHITDVRVFKRGW